MPAVPVEYTPAQRIIAAATRLREAWRIPNLDIAEMHEAVMSLVYSTTRLMPSLRLDSQP
jgi:hypothetical protein